MITVTVLHQENHREQRTPSPISSPLCSPLNARPPFGRSTPSPLLSVVLSPPAALPASPGAPPTAAPIGCGRAGRAPGGGGAQHGARGGPSAEPGVGGLRVWGRAQPHRGLPQTHKGILGGGGGGTGPFWGSSPSSEAMAARVGAEQEAKMASRTRLPLRWQARDRKWPCDVTKGAGLQ